MSALSLDRFIKTLSLLKYQSPVFARESMRMILSKASSPYVRGCLTFEALGRLALCILVTESSCRTGAKDTSS
jgi:hypothetical protein